MDDQQNIQALTSLLTTVTAVTILLPETATRDALASALGLYLSLQQLQKEVTIYYPKQAIVGWSHLVGVNKLKQKLGSKNFVISLDYIEGSIEKVSYNIAGNKFNLVIEPRGETATFDEKNVSYNYSGFMTDMIFAVGAMSKDALGKYFSENPAIFNEKSVVVIDNKAENTRFGKINFVTQSAAVAEIVAGVIKSAQFPIDADIASNLYDGLIFGSRNFVSPQVSAETFEMAAYLLHQGARKNSPPKQQEEAPVREYLMKNTPDSSLPPPPDWLKPKIYKSSSLL